MAKLGQRAQLGMVLLLLLPLAGRSQEVPPDGNPLLLGRPLLLLEPNSGQPSPVPDSQDRPRGPLVHVDRADGWWGTLNTHLLVHDPRDPSEEPILGGRWLTKEALQVSVAGPVFFFGKVGAGFDTLTAQQQRLTSRTGLGCRLVPCAGTEILFHGGPALTHAEDPLRPDLLARDHTEMLLELQCRCPLAGPVHLEYQGTAVPALSPLERNRLDHDLRFAVPLGTTGSFRLGAKCHWEDAVTPRPLADTMELYLGVGLNR